jgi:hypothetical protein
VFSTKPIAPSSLFAFCHSVLFNKIIKEKEGGRFYTHTHARTEEEERLIHRRREEKREKKRERGKERYVLRSSFAI